MKTINKNLIVILMFGMFLFSLSNIGALDNLGTFTQNQEVRLSQVCSDSTYINITSISYPNSTVAESNIEMNIADSGEFYYLFNKTSDLGKYYVRSLSDGCEKSFTYYFLVEEESSKGLFALNNLDDGISLTLFILFLVIAGVLFFLQQPLISALIIIIEGFILLMNGINLILSLILIAVGILIAFMGGDD